MNNNATEQNENKREAIPVPTLDYDIYRGDLADLKLTAAQENELLTILWDIMRMMVDLNLDMDAVHVLMPPSLCKAFNEDGEDDEAEQKRNRSAGTQNERSRNG
ncbi:hypothetical protein [Nitrosomonas sp. JL21]|uniref:hypothetical protein n=1 Tax=Nitrosomonas sp. JL21 TaxID=153949 RepID=UPI00136BC682|nr:hypothetical protein [Nitrosomonas sp. JL21]